MKNQNSLGSITSHKAFQYKLKLNQEQELLCRKYSGAARFVYNWGLTRWQENRVKGINTSAYSLMNELVFLKQLPEYNWLNEMVAKSVRYPLLNLEKAFKSFFQKRGQYPQFKKKGIRDSFHFPDKFTILEDNSLLRLPKMGLIRYVQDRKMEGVPKSITISRKADGWYASVMCEITFERKLNESHSYIGVDLGVVNLATTWDGQQAYFHQHSPKLKQEYERLAILQKQHSHKVKGSSNRNKARQKVAKQHQRITQIRKNTIHKLSHTLCKNHALIIMEDLKVINMSKSASGTVDNPGKNVSQKRGLNRSILQQGWSELVRQINYKCLWYGSMIVLVDPAYTSQTCPACNHREKANRKTQARFSCISCGYGQHADIVGAINIRKAATARLH